MTEREQLIQYLQAKESLQLHINTAKKKYIDSLGSNPLIFISNHATVRYLERVLDHQLGDEDNDGDKLHTYLRKHNIDARELRKEILSVGEMKHIVSNEIKRYTKGNYTYIIDKLALVTVHPAGII